MIPGENITASDIYQKAPRDWTNYIVSFYYFTFETVS